MVIIAYRADFSEQPPSLAILPIVGSQFAFGPQTNGNRNIFLFPKIFPNPVVPDFKVHMFNPHFSPQGATAGLSSSVFPKFSMHCWTSQQWHPVAHFTRVVRNAS